MQEMLKAERLLQLGTRSGLAVLDQAVYSGGNFAISLALARWLTPEAYGAYALALGVFLVLSGIHNALILEPMSVLATANYAPGLGTYLSGQFGIHVLVTASLGVLAALGAGGLLVSGLGTAELGWAVLAIGACLPGLLLVWLVRRIFYILQRPGAALLASCVYTGVVSAGGLVLHSQAAGGRVFAWIGLMALGSVLASTSILLFVKFERMPTWQNIWSTFRSDQWRLGRAILIATLLYSLGSQVQVFVTASLLGLGTAGALRAIQNFSLPILQVVAAVAALAMPSIASNFGQQQLRRLRLNCLTVGAGLVLAAIGYEALLVFGAPSIAHILYQGKFSEFQWLIPVLGIAPMLAAAQTAFSLMLRSLQKAEFYIIDKAIAASVGVVSALVLVRYWAVAGAVASLALVEFFTLATYLLLYYRWFVPRLRVQAQ